MKYKEYFDLGEINIFVDEKGYRFVNVGGTVIDISEDVAGVILAIQGHTVSGAYNILKKCGFKIDKKTVDDVAKFLKDENLVNIEFKKPKSRRFETIKTLNNLKNGWFGPLIIQDVAVTASSACPMNCKYCFREYFPYRHKDKLNFDIIKKLIDDLRQLGCLTINISGGEPASFSELTRDIGNYAKVSGFENISVSTCGYGLDEKILREWKNAGITYLNLSLDTMDEEVQDKIFRKKGAWISAVNSCKIACKVGLQVRINATCYREAIPSIEKLAEFGKKVGAYKVRYNPLVPSAELPPVSPNEMKDMVRRVRELEKRGFPVYTPIEPDDILPEFLICAAGITKAVIEVDGSVGGCQFMGNYPEPAGNITETNFLNIWTKGNWDYFRRDLTNRKLAKPCRNCKDRHYCISYCLAYAQSLLGDAKVTSEIKCPWERDKDEKL